MSLEERIAENTVAVRALTELILTWDKAPIATQETVPAPAPAPTFAPAPPAAVPAFAAPLPTVAPAAAAPFTDSKGLMAYCMAKYGALGPVKGGMIQQVLVELGHQNLNSIPASQYADFFAKVEAL